MNAILFGATGMVGSGVLQACLEDPRVQAVLVVGRSPCAVVHPKVQEQLHADFFDYAAIQARWASYDVCFFCLGVSSALPFKAAYMFRPGYIQLLKGVRSKTRLYQAIYDVLGPLYPLLRLMPRWVTSSSAIGQAMIRVAAEGYSSPILESLGINRVSEGTRALGGTS